MDGDGANRGTQQLEPCHSLSLSVEHDLLGDVDVPEAGDNPDIGYSTFRGRGHDFVTMHNLNDDGGLFDSSATLFFLLIRCKALDSI